MHTGAVQTQQDKPACVWFLGPTSSPLDYLALVLRMGAAHRPSLLLLSLFKTKSEAGSKLHALPGLCLTIRKVPVVEVAIVCLFGPNFLIVYGFSVMGTDMPLNTSVKRKSQTHTHTHTHTHTITTTTTTTTQNTATVKTTEIHIQILFLLLCFFYLGWI